ncbi:M10 family metallopeptidase C-terminal domain-containing protein [Aliiroseovarius marinus]|uniref:M10 family metallopeptidase C-terminal domain-containing protein n=1 Tax=Aliiroseovarius marinus TaxID=2500159 RepID=UPI003D7DE387
MHKAETFFQWGAQANNVVTSYQAKPFGGDQGLAYHLTSGFAAYLKTPKNAHFDLEPGRVITFNADKLSKSGKWFAYKALAAWSAVSGISFKKVAFSKSDIRFDDAQKGAYSVNYYKGSEIVKAHINVSKDWIAGDAYKLVSYGYQTYLHELGHALGLGHPGNYNGHGSFHKHAKFADDSWQSSVMSYFSQTENPNVVGSKAYVVTPMSADIHAIQNLYGVPSGAKKVNAGNTIWGVHSNAAGPAKLFSKTKYVGAMTVFDQGGIDVLKFTHTLKDQKISLSPGSFSNVRGKYKNVKIEKKTIIENIKSGAGDDQLFGNWVANKIWAGNGNDLVRSWRGNDMVNGLGGNDRIFGGDGNDRLYGADGNDYLVGDGGSDKIYGGNHADTVYGSTGHDLISGGRGNDHLYGGDQNDQLYGNTGSDFLIGGNGNDQLYGGDHTDFLYGSAGNDVLVGGNGNDRLYGGDHDDQLGGSSGDDILSGGSGADLLTGGLGADVFEFTAGNDTIVDFNRSERDTIRIKASLVATTDAAQFLIDNAEIVNGNAVITLDNGDSLTVNGVTGLTALADDIQFF